jgi:serpin B
VTLEIANRVWVQADFPLLPDFTREVEKTFGAGFASADFRTRGEAARQEINGWVEKQTRDRIQNLIPAGLLNSLTRMVLVNAVYFYGAWQTPL